MSLQVDVAMACVYLSGPRNAFLRRHTS